MLYRQMGVFLPRDSKDQVKSSLFVETSLSLLKAGDLIFFGLEQGKIRHVGMYLGDDQFIHSTVAENQPYIRISQLSSPEWSGGGRFKYRTFRTLA
jgi:cell wall-associated NlpC family hydrolase